MMRSGESRSLRPGGAGGGRSCSRFRAAAAALALLVLPLAAAADDRFTVCSITINSDDEIRTFRKYLPESEFRFVELTDHARTTSPDPQSTWFGRACESGVRCDVLLLSAHFGNTYAGNYGTTFAGRSGHTLPLEEMEQRRCDETCTGILRDPLEVYLFGCKTLSTTLEGNALSAADFAVLADHGVSPVEAERILDEARHGSEGTSNRQRMEFVFSGVPRIYGFTEVAPSGGQIAPLLDRYLAGYGDYAERLRRLRPSSSPDRSVPNLGLAATLSPTCFTQTFGLALGGPEAARAERSCLVSSAKRPLASRLARIEALLEQPGFVADLPLVEEFFREQDPAAFGAEETAALRRIRGHERGRVVVADLVRRLDDPVLRLEILRAGLALGWTTRTEALPVEREIAVRLLRPPVWGEARDRICALEPAAVERFDVRAEEVPAQTYENEFGIQALGCLRPSDERIHERLARSLSDSREWIARLAAIALRAMRPARVDVQIALAEQLRRPEPGPRQWAAEALRALKPSDPRVLATIRATDPSFAIDWL